MNLIQFVDPKYISLFRLITNQFIMKQIFIFITILSIISCIVPEDQVIGIQMVNEVYNGKWYSGYLDNQDGTHMHYFFFPSQNPSDPVLLWFNGGPGCSSLLGALYQHGPFVFSDAFGILINNKYSWNKKAHVLYLQSPAQVGFSYSDQNKTWTDDNTAQLNMKTLITFYTKWKEYQVNDLYLSGESYAGIYVPTLAEKIDSYNQNPTNGIINLKGFAVGNGCTHPQECEFLSDIPTFMIQLYEELGFIPTQLADKIKDVCKGQTFNISDQCHQLLDKINQISGYRYGMNIYDVYRPCYDNSDPTKSQKYANVSFLTKIQMGLRIKKNLRDNLPCFDGYGMDVLLNNPQNRAKLNIRDESPKYSMCNDDPAFNYRVDGLGSYWVYQKLIPKNKYKIFVYSGTADPCVPFTGTIYWVNLIRKKLQLSTIQYWRPWFTSTEAGIQNAGNIWRLKGLNLITFRGIGHMAPQWNPPAGVKMINALLHDDPI